MSPGPFAELLASPGVEEEVQLRSRFGFLAFHGGSLEERTDIVAAQAAEAAGASLYAVRQPADMRWHLPSRLVRPEESTALARFLDHVDTTIAVHGYGRHDHWTTLLLGGRNRELASHVAGHLRPALPEYDVVAELDRIPVELRGVHPENPVNRCRGGGSGVQLELPPRVRGMGPYWAEHPPGVPVPHTEALVGALATAAVRWSG